MGLIVAGKFEREHKNVIQAIENLEWSQKFAKLKLESPLEPDSLFENLLGGVAQIPPLFLKICFRYHKVFESG